jgi:hypothetical protein
MAIREDVVTSAVSVPITGFMTLANGLKVTCMISYCYPER